jgi:hypothetical protein
MKINHTETSLPIWGGSVIIVKKDMSNFTIGWIFTGYPGESCVSSWCVSGPIGYGGTNPYTFSEYPYWILKEDLLEDIKFYPIVKSISTKKINRFDMLDIR